MTAVESLGRCAFILFKILEGDHKGLIYAPLVLQEAVSLLKSMGIEEEWLDQISDQFFDHQGE